MLLRNLPIPRMTLRAFMGVPTALALEYLAALRLLLHGPYLNAPHVYSPVSKYINPDFPLAVHCPAYLVCAPRWLELTDGPSKAM